MELHPAPSGWSVGEFLTEAGLEQLSRFKYVAGPYTYLDNVLNPWWLFVAKFVPAWVSPNLVTLIGLFFTVSSMLFTAVVCNGDPSIYINGNMIYTVTAFSMFAYQTLDAVDGKHARNTGQSTPLGALFDHGCDAVAATGGVIALELCSSTPGTEAEEVRTIAGAIAFILPPVSFFAAQWEHLYTHQMPAGGVTEAQYCGIVVTLIAAMWGPSFFQADVSTALPAPMAAVLGALVGGPKGIVVKKIMQAFTTLFAVVLTAGSIFRCVRQCSFKCLPALLPVAVLSMLTCILYVGSTNVFVEHRLLCLSAAGLVIVDLNIRMVVAAVCRFQFPILPVTMVPFGLTCFAGVVLPALGVQHDRANRLHLSFVVFCLFWQLFSMLLLVGDTILKVCEKLDIPFLAPVKKSDEKPVSTVPVKSRPISEEAKQVRQRRAESPKPQARADTQ